MDGHQPELLAGRRTPRQRELHLLHAVTVGVDVGVMAGSMFALIVARCTADQRGVHFVCATCVEALTAPYSRRGAASWANIKRFLSNVFTLKPKEKILIFTFYNHVDPVAVYPHVADPRSERAFEK